MELDDIIQGEARATSRQDRHGPDFSLSRFSQPGERVCAGGENRFAEGGWVRLWRRDGTREIAPHGSREETTPAQL